VASLYQAKVITTEEQRKRTLIPKPKGLSIPSSHNTEENRLWEDMDRNALFFHWLN
jgi:hypothetical protein